MNITLFGQVPFGTWFARYSIVLGGGSNPDWWIGITQSSPYANT